MLSVVTIVVLLYAIAVAVDWALTTEAAQRYREVALDARRSLSDLDTHIATQTLNAQFQYLFEAIYTPRFFSAQRLLRSTASSIAAVIVLLLVFALIFSPGDIPGFLRSVFEERKFDTYGDKKVWSGVTSMLVINLFADYVSLQETSWILRRSQGRRLFGLILWTIVDLTLTAAIWIVAVLGLALFAQIFFEFFPLPDSDNPIAFVCMASTFVTSALWIGFFVSALAIRGLKRLSPVFRVALQVIGESSNPGRMTAGLIALTIGSVYGAIQLTSWLS